MASAEARFCPACGSPLPELAPPAAPPGAGAVDAPDPRGGRARLSRTLVVGGLAVAVAAAGGAGAIVLLTGGDDHRAARATRHEAATAQVSRAAVADVVQRYATAYSSESVPALRALFAPRFRRRNDGDPVEGRAAALATYASQFRQLRDPSYRVARLSITTGPGSASAAARYRISSAAGSVGGRIRFELADVHGKLLITRVTVAPTVAPTVARADAASLVRRYAAAYSAESVQGLGALLAPGFRRRNDGDPVEGRSAALATYAGQFEGLTDPTYRVSGLSITTGPGVAWAGGRYRIVHAQGTVTGLISFSMATLRGKLFITRITTTPKGATPAPDQSRPPGGGSQSGDGGGGQSGGGQSGGGDGGGLLWYGPSLPPPSVPDLN